jgi:hypothetical protein
MSLFWIGVGVAVIALVVEYIFRRKLNNLQRIRNRSIEEDKAIKRYNALTMTMFFFAIAGAALIVIDVFVLNSFNV